MPAKFNWITRTVAALEAEQALNDLEADGVEVYSVTPRLDAAGVWQVFILAKSEVPSGRAGFGSNPTRG